MTALILLDITLVSVSDGFVAVRMSLGLGGFPLPLSTFHHLGPVGPPAHIAPVVAMTGWAGDPQWGSHTFTSGLEGFTYVTDRSVNYVL